MKTYRLTGICRFIRDRVFNLSERKFGSLDSASHFNPETLKKFFYDNLKELRRYKGELPEDYNIGTHQSKIKFVNKGRIEELETRIRLDLRNLEEKDHNIYDLHIYVI